MTHLDHLLFTRRRALQAGAGLTLAGTGLSALSQPAPPQQLTVAIIGDGRTGIWATLRAGENSQRVEAKLGTKVAYQPGFTASLPVMEAIKAGGVDFTFATATAVVNAAGANVPIVPLAAFPLPTNTVDLVVKADSPIRSAADLKGKRIAHQNGTTGTYSLIKYLESGGLRLSDVQAVSLSGADAYTAFAQGSVDAWIHWQHASSLAQARLGDRVRVLPNVKTYDYAFYVARADLAEKHPQTVARLVRIIRDAQTAINKDPAGTVALWASQGGFAPDSLERKVFEKLIADQRLSESTATGLKPVDEAAAASTQDLADNFHSLGVLPRRIDVRSFLLDKRFDAIKRVVANELAQA
jgi:sulfonate transport system substrate-binding protein